MSPVRQPASSALHPPRAVSRTVQTLERITRLEETVRAQNQRIAHLERLVRPQQARPVRRPAARRADVGGLASCLCEGGGHEGQAAPRHE